MSSLRNGVKQVRVERPRPLKMGGGTQPELGLGDLVTVLESVTRSLAGSGKPVMAGAGDPGVIRQLETLAANLRMTGPQLELSHKDLMDSWTGALTEACRQEAWPAVARVHMLELLEMRSMAWAPSESVTSYYRQKLAEIEAKNQAAAAQQPRTAPVRLNCDAREFDPIKPSLKQSQSLDISGPMVKEESPLQKTNQITAKKAEIKADVKEFSQTIRIRDESITVTGKSLELVKTAKIVLHEFFNVIPTEEKDLDKDEDRSQLATAASSLPPSVESSYKTVQSENEEEEDTGIELIKPKISYNKQELMAMARSPFCRETPTSWTEIAKELPGVVRRQERPGPTSKLILREMEGLRRQEEAKMV